MKPIQNHSEVHEPRIIVRAALAPSDKTAQWTAITYLAFMLGAALGCLITALLMQAVWVR